MLKRKSALMVDMSEVLREFEEISGWESLEDGLWNGKWNQTDKIITISWS